MFKRHLHKFRQIKKFFTLKFEHLIELTASKFAPIKLSLLLTDFTKNRPINPAKYSKTPFNRVCILNNPDQKMFTNYFFTGPPASFSQSSDHSKSWSVLPLLKTILFPNTVCRTRILRGFFRHSRGSFLKTL